MSIIKYQRPKLITIISLLAGLVVLMLSSIMLKAVPACHQCTPTGGCITTGYGFNECHSDWKNGKLVSCTLSGGECGGGGGELQ